MNLSDYLWNDEEFLRKRQSEQVIYLEELEASEKPEQRKEELRESALFVLERVELQYKRVLNRRCKCS